MQGGKRETPGSMGRVPLGGSDGRCITNTHIEARVRG
jgi:hypothetical protein